LRGANDAGVHLHAPLREHFVLSKPNRGEASSAVDPDFAEALEEDGSKRDSASRRAEYKTRQLCRQVQRALNLALAERGLDLGLEELYVDEVTPAAGCGRLLVHLAGDVCIGVAIGTTHLIYPQAVGGDIGCGVLAVPFDVRADRLAEPAIAGRVLAKLAGAVPARRWNRKMTMEPPHDVASDTLSDPRLDAVWRKQGTLELATLGSGNHFAELQVDGEDRLWLMVHSGSRAMGPAIRDFHLERAEVAGSSGLRALDANSVQGRAYLHDTAWARRYAAANRQQIAMNIGTILVATIDATLQWDLAITTDHNHVESEPHSGGTFWVHRKGAMAAAHDQWGALQARWAPQAFTCRDEAALRLCARVPTAQAG
jgi:hypothetical protein